MIKLSLLFHVLIAALLITILIRVVVITLYWPIHEAVVGESFDRIAKINYIPRLGTPIEVLMELRTKPKLLAAILSGGTVVLLAGVAVAATLPGPHKDSSTTGSRTPVVSRSDDAAKLVAPMAFGQSLTPTPSTSSISPPAQPSPAGTPPAQLPVSTPPAGVPVAGSPTPPALVASGASAPTSSAPSTTASTSGPIKTDSVTYVVRPGDTLYTIAVWFKQHGYSGLYAWNKEVIGSDPNLIRPGERFTVSNGVMSVAP